MLRILERARARLFPTAHERTVRRYFRDGGDERFRFAYDLRPDSLVLDLGGYRGQWASDLFARYLCRILVFEPVREYAAAIAARFARNDRITVYDFALGGASRRESIRVRGDASSVFGRAGVGRQIRIVDAAQWLREQGIDSVQLMKINVEGGEYELLERLLEADLVAMIDHLQVQFHDLFPGAEQRMVAIQDALSRTHELTFQYKFTWESWARKQARRPPAPLRPWPCGACASGGGSGAASP